MTSITNRISGNNVVPRVATMAASALVTLGVTTPAMAASLHAALPFATRDIALGGTLVLLVAWLAVRLMRDRESEESLPAAPDLRWWRDPQS